MIYVDTTSLVTFNCWQVESVLSLLKEVIMMWIEYHDIFQILILLPSTNVHLFTDSCGMC